MEYRIKLSTSADMDELEKLYDDLNDYLSATINYPAISLYEKYGFEYMGTVDLGLGQYGLDWFKVYEKVI
nr:hypothetical protein [uncultured Bacteroides sp.]